MGTYANAQVLKAKNAEQYLVQRVSPASSELYYGNDLANISSVTNIAEHTKEYNWFTTDLVKWKMFDGKMSEGIYSSRKILIRRRNIRLSFIFMSVISDGCIITEAPAPSASTINIPYFVSNRVPGL
jgi:hypothetical protein